MQTGMEPGDIPCACKRREGANLPLLRSEERPGGHGREVDRERANFRNGSNSVAQSDLVFDLSHDSRRCAVPAFTAVLLRFNANWLKRGRRNQGMADKKTRNGEFGAGELERAHLGVWDSGFCDRRLLLLADMVADARL